MTPRGEPARLLALALALLLLAGCAAAPGPFELSSATRGGDRVPFLAGVATVDFTPPRGYPLGGYGGGARRAAWPPLLGLGWPGRYSLWLRQAWPPGAGPCDLLAPALGTLDPLTARALVLRPQGAPPAAIVRMDAIGTTAELHDLVVAGLAGLGYRRDRVLLAATHTHSGPGGYFRAPLARLAAMDRYLPEVEARIARACVEAVRAAHTAARPAALGFARVRDRGAGGAPVVARNRRSGRFPGEVGRDDVDDEVGLLLVTGAGGGAPLAAVVSYAVHPTVYGSDNLFFSADLAGAIERALEARLGGASVLFLNGAEGDVGPGRLVSRAPSARCRELGEALAASVAPVLSAIAVHGSIRLSTAAGERDLGPPRTLLAHPRGRFLDAEAGPAGRAAGWATALLALPANALLWALGLTNVSVAVTWNGAAGVVVDLAGYTGRTRTRFGGLRLEAGPDDVVLLGVPGEPTHDVGLELRARCAARGATRSFVVGLAFDHVGYLASRVEYRRGGYEAWSTLFGEHAAERVVEAEEQVLDALYGGTRPPEDGT